jgi:hypothetical protein
MKGGGEEGLGEDVVYDGLDHIAMRDAGPVHDLPGPSTLGELCELLGEIDLPGRSPVRDASRHYRRAFESAALDLALRQNGRSRGGREGRPVTFVNSTSAVFAATSRRAPSRSATGSKNWPAALQARPRERLTPELIAGAERDRGVDILDLKGLYRGRGGSSTPTPSSTGPSRTWPGAYLEDPTQRRGPPRPRAALRPHHVGREPSRLDDVLSLERQPKRSTSRRAGSLKELLSVYEALRARGIAVYGGGQGEQGVGLRRSECSGSSPDAERRRAVGLQRPRSPARPADEPARSELRVGDRISLGRVRRP